jgi:NAD(P)-dependent dehydrogenase (short-subunit alcohol dehydrogenase family)
VQAVQPSAGALAAAVNNAGIAVTAPLEGLALADLRRQLKTAFVRSRCFI